MKPNCKPNFPCPPPDFPPFCPPPVPPVPPCSPQVPSVVEGDSLYQCVQRLSDKVNVCINTYNNVMANCYETLRNLEHAASSNGSYYNRCEVWTEEGYLPDESAAYKIIHKAAVDRHGEPIFMQLHVAYGNTTNSGITQEIFSASKVALADKMVTAQVPITGTVGWWGNVIYQGSPIPSNENAALYTVGFTRNGTMRVYNNSISIDQMLCDTVENAMGCPGVLVQNGQLCDESWYQNIPEYNTQQSRIVMGQNTATGEVLILVCGKEDNVSKKGMTSLAAAKILMQYGCTIVVEIAEGANSGAADKGCLMYVPDNDEVPADTCYWYITRRCHYHNDYQRELAELFQNYGTAIWKSYLNSKKIAKLQLALEQEVQDRIDGDNDLLQKLNEEISRAMEAEEMLQTNINKEVERAMAAEAMLQENINKETERAEAAESTLQQNIDKEQERAEAAEATLQQNIEAETARAEAAETQIQNNLDAEVSRSTAEDEKHDAAIAKLQTDLDTEVHDRTNADAALHQEILTEQGARIAADTTLQQNINTEASDRADEDAKIVAQLNQEVSTLTTAITAIEGDISALQDLYRTLTNQMATLDETVSALQTTIHTIETTLNNIKTTISDLQTSILDIQNNYLKLSGGTMTGNINMGGNTISNVAAPTQDNDVANKKYVDESIAAIPLEDYLPTAGGNMSGNIEMNGNGITGLKQPVNDNDATTKKYVDDAVAGISTDNFVQKTGDTMTGPLKVSDGTNTSEVSTKNITIANGNEEIEMGELPLPNDTTGFGISAMGDLNLHTGGAIALSDTDSTDPVRIANVADPTQQLDAVNKKTLDAAIAGIPQGDFLPLSGGTMSGDINAGGNTVTNLKAPAANGDAATKQYVDEAIADIPSGNYLPLSGGQMSGTAKVRWEGTDAKGDIGYQTGYGAYSTSFGVSNNDPTDPLYLLSRSGKVQLGTRLSPDYDQVILSGVKTPESFNDAVNKSYNDNWWRGPNLPQYIQIPLQGIAIEENLATMPSLYNAADCTISIPPETTNLRIKNDWTFNLNVNIVTKTINYEKPNAPYVIAFSIPVENNPFPTLSDIMNLTGHVSGRAYNPDVSGGFCCAGSIIYVPSSHKIYVGIDFNYSRGGALTYNVTLGGILHRA